MKLGKQREMIFQIIINVGLFNQLFPFFLSAKYVDTKLRAGNKVSNFDIV